MPTSAEDWPRLIAAGDDTACDRFLREKLPGILEVVGGERDRRPSGHAQCATHCDYHPGNLKWIDEQGVGLFDFDWAKLDHRLFDVAQGICYFCTSWEGDDKGTLRIDKAEVFLRGYQDEASRWEHPGRMSAEELALLPRMIANANLYILNWDVTYFYGSPDSDVDEYMRFFLGQVNCMEYIEEHMDELAAMARALRLSGAAQTSQYCRLRLPGALDRGRALMRARPHRGRRLVEHGAQDGLDGPGRSPPGRSRPRG